MGIGTLNEKSIHNKLKSYIEPNILYHEIKIDKYIADIKRDNKIYEIQTRNFKGLLSKIDKYIKLGLNVTIIYPIQEIKFINWINVESNNIEERRKSSKKGCIQDIFKEIYWVQDYIKNNQITIRMITLETEEYRYLDGYGINNKKRATKIDVEYTNILKDVEIKSIKDMQVFIPNTLKNINWTVKDYIKQTNSNTKYIGSGIKILRELGVIEVVNKIGNSYVYRYKDIK